MKEKLKKIWKDPVWSKIIAALILSILTLIYNYLQSVIKKESFYKTLSNFWNSKFELWQITLVFFIIILLIYISIKKRKRNKTEEIGSFDGVDILSLTYASNYGYDEESKKLDIQLFNKIRTEFLPAEKDINWLREQSFNNGFQKEKAYTFFDFDEMLSENPNFEFLNSDLEELKRKLIQKIQIFTNDLSVNTFPENNKDFQGVPKEWRDNHPEKYLNAVQILNKDKKEVLDSYDELIRAGRKILKV
ncbi:hypothetical protein [Epilithonimonas sp.]|uniref:hypothetical protein n=1 Tax=Epilithonimonas sp. TaxID=2894511 RepID=UPI00289AE701|nr:hypothetical protein [Epilithonimonas sp.]